MEGHPSPPRWQLDPMYHLAQLLQHLTRPHPVTVQLRAPILLPPGTINPHQVPSLEVPPSVPCFATVLLNRSTSPSLCGCKGAVRVFCMCLCRPARHAWDLAHPPQGAPSPRPLSFHSIGSRWESAGAGTWHQHWHVEPQPCTPLSRRTVPALPIAVQFAPPAL